MNDKKLEEYLRVVEPNFNTHLEKDTIEMNLEYYNMLEERMVRLINKTNNLQSKIDKAIEYIEKEKYVSADENCEIIAGYHIDELLDILKKDK